MNWAERIEQALNGFRAEGRFRTLGQDPALSFSHNDYLGLASHPGFQDLPPPAKAGSTGSRLLGGHSTIFEETEAAIAAYFQSPSALFFSSGYLANLAAVTAMGSLAAEIVCDEKIHASLIDGVRLSGKPKHIMPHQSWAVPESGLQRLFIAESLYSMDGTVLDFDNLLPVLARDQGFLIVDEAHAAGVFEASGRGFCVAAFGGRIDWDRTLVTVTFGKAFGVAGAAILCSERVRDWIINTGRSFIFTTATSPRVCQLVQRSLQIMAEEGAGRRRELWSRAEGVRQYWEDHGVLAPTLNSLSSRDWRKRVPIISVPLAGNVKALSFAEVMRNSGWGVRAIRYPTVPAGAERIRVSVNLSVSLDQTMEFARKVAEQWKVFL